MEQQETRRDMNVNGNPLKIVENFLVDCFGGENVEAALLSLCEDVECSWIGDTASLSGKEMFYRKMVERRENERIYLINTALTCKMAGDQVGVVTGSVECGKKGQEEAAKIVVQLIAVCMLKEKNWKISKLYFSFPLSIDPMNIPAYKSVACLEPVHGYCWRSTIDQALPSGILVLCWSSGGNICHINKMMLNYLGYQSQEEYERLSGTSIYNLLHSDEIDRFKIRLEEVHAGKENPPFICRMRTITHSYDWFSIKEVSLPTNKRANAILCVCTNVSDLITEQKEILKQREMLEDVRAALNTLIENMPGGVHRCRLFEKASLDFVSDGLCQMVGYSNSEIEQVFNSEYVGLIYKEDRHAFTDAIKELKEYPHTKILKYRLQHKNGTVFWVSDAVKSVRHMDGKMWAYAVVTNIDNEQKTIERLESVADNIPCGVAFYEYNNCKVYLQYCNETFAMLIGSTIEEYKIAANINPFVFVYEEDIDILLRGLEKLSGGDGQTECQFRIHTQSGCRRLYIIAKTVSRIGRWVRFTAVLMDVTDGIQLVNREAPRKETEKKVSVRTFGYFDVFLNGKAIPFRHSKSKELLAILIDRRGGFVSSGDIISCLWEEETVNKTTQSRCRKVQLRLIEELKRYGIEEIVESKNGLRRIVTEMVECDLFQYCSGQEQYKHLFKGAYLTNYSWGELTLGELLNI